MTKKMFMSPNLARRVAGVGIGVAPPLSPRTSARRRRCEDEMDLIMPTSPTSSEVNGNGEAEEEAVANVEVVGFASPRKFRSAVPQRVVQSFRLQSRQYNELGSLNPTGGPQPMTSNATSTNRTPLLATRSLLADAVEERVQTATGQIVVARQGDVKKPAIITYHDIGMNYLTNFQTFFTSSEMSAVLDAFCVYHVNAPGQAPGEEELPEDFAFPSMEELSEQVEYVLHYYGIANCVGFGVGFGANVLTRLAHRRPTMVDGLVLVNCNSTASGWLEWVYHKVNIKSLKKLTNSTNVVKLPEGVIEYLVWYHLGRVDTMAAMSLASILKQHFSCEVHPRNLCLLLQCFMQRTDLGLTREVAANGKPLFATSSRTLKTPVLNMTGDHSPHVDATVAFNGRLQPSKCTWMKFQDSAMVLEEQPAKVAEAVKLFLQGLGYVFKRSLQKSSVKSTPVLKRPEKPKEDNKETESDNKEQDLIDIQSQNKQVEVTN